MAAEKHTICLEVSEELLVALRETPEGFARQARVALAVKLYEMGKLSSGTAAQLCGLPRVAFLLELERFGVSAFGQSPEDLASDVRDA